MTLGEKIRLFQSRFAGRDDAYGTYSPVSGRSWQVKAQVSEQVIAQHVRGHRPFGLYPLRVDRVKAAAVDFDEHDGNPPLDLVRAAQAYGVGCSIEISKSKGYHVWFLLREWTPAKTVRAFLRMLLDEIGRPQTEIFPKQDAIPPGGGYGNFINAPLFGRLVSKGKTVFTDRHLRPVSDQWVFLSRVKLIDAAHLEEVVQINGGEVAEEGCTEAVAPGVRSKGGFALPPCTIQMLERGVRQNQRVSCFWMAVQLRKTGLPPHSALVVLLDWAKRNRPSEGRRIITPEEVREQTQAAYGSRQYLGCGCQSEAVSPFCDPRCPILRRKFASS